MHNFVKKWREHVGKEDKALPTPQEMLDGLKDWLMGHIDKDAKGPELIKQIYQEAFEKLCDSIAFQHTCEPMIYRTKSQEEYDHENNLFNPYGKVACFVLYLFSMEIGHEPLYAAVNKANRENESTLLTQLGPYIIALSYITNAAESKRQKLDRIDPGTMVGGKSCCLSGSFLLYRGTHIKKNKRFEYGDKEMQQFNIPGFIAFSRNFQVAIE